MDIEKLTKSQIVLLTLLVSFMTSIATGIVTVSLMQQAPPAITQTVSKIVEHTVEKVVPNQPAAVALTLPPKPIKTDVSSSISSAVTAAEPSVVRLYSTDESAHFLGLGVIVSLNVIAVDAGILDNSADAIILQPGGKKVHVFVRRRNDTLGLAFMSPGTSTESVTWSPAMLGAEHPALGQTVIVLGGKTATRIGIGVVTALSPGPDNDTQILETNLQESDILSGSPVIDTDGSIIGVSTAVGRASSRAGFISASALNPGAKKETNASSAQ